jgi:hypothetical protein
MRKNGVLSLWMLSWPSLCRRLRDPEKNEDLHFFLNRGPRSGREPFRALKAAEWPEGGVCWDDRAVML